jgi:hypothetical protein
MNLQSLAYHRRVADTLEAKEKDLWDWFRSDKFATQYEKEARHRLNKSAVRLGRDGNANNARRYELAEKARDALGLKGDIVLYQSQETGGAPNAMLHYIPGQITIEFVGRVLELLDDDELLDLLGHEIAHYKLYEEESGRYHTATRLIYWICKRDACPPVWFETARRLSLYTEVYCDTAGYIVSGNRDTTIRSLAKMIADFKDADAKSYLAQAEEILAQENTGSQGMTHPELYIRAKAIANRAALDADDFEASLVPLIEGPLNIAEADILGQETLQDLTRAVIDCFTRLEMNQTEPVEIHARHYFPKYKWPGKSIPPGFALPSVAPQTRDYLGYVLLDFAQCDQSRSDEALGSALVVARQIGLEGPFRAVARKELRKTADELAKIEQYAAKLLSEVGHG